MINLIRDKYLKYVRNSQSKKSKYRIFKRTWIDIFPKILFKWPAGTQKDAPVTNNDGNANQIHSEISVRMTITKKTSDNKCWEICGEKGTLVYCWWKCKLVQPLWKTVWRFFKKFKIELPYDPATPLLSVHPKEIKSLSQTDICTSMFIATLFTIAKTWKQPKCQWMNRWSKCGVHT